MNTSNPASTAEAADFESKSSSTRGRSRKYAQVLAVINQAAIEVFAADGPQGATTQAIADKAGLSKAQLHYYIGSKDALYRQVLQDIIDDWISVFGFADEAYGARRVLSDLIRRKMIFSFEQPLRSRIFAAEMMRGAPVLRPMMEVQSKRRTEQAAAVITNWTSQGQMGPVDPVLFLFHLWAVTQFYADHAEQVHFFRGGATADDPKEREYLIAQVTAFLLRGAGVK
ncbi:TetR family transcriptional regulator C-terminal domain-containing protein [Variovorax dokdonensis]|uniref:TetR family transcriptional regulator C-terminal domain-containing protein n=1 Tax=Variovorax dokdonensis TaxID=344883 RepID=A0ABT7NE35_9BURK|nr:TetR family transcriptional regulator C-terminal domain-containing protein [Variovorax dokdonensis]MDM0046194.1 TetR family transcriptional regulator C-terminal domain-containing protein [Variovorax dokdonensis]